MNKNITVLGSTGSIGTQTLDVVKNLGLTVNGLCANSNVSLLEQQAREFDPRCVAIGDTSRYSQLKTALADTDIKVVAGEEAIKELAAEKADVVLNAVVGIAGLGATLAAINAGNTLALANKESLVTGGELVMYFWFRSFEFTNVSQYGYDLLLSCKFKNSTPHIIALSQIFVNLNLQSKNHSLLC